MASTCRHDPRPARRGRRATCRLPPGRRAELDASASSMLASASAGSPGRCGECPRTSRRRLRPRRSRRTARPDRLLSPLNPASGSRKSSARPNRDPRCTPHVGRRSRWRCDGPPAPLVGRPLVFPQHPPGQPGGGERAGSPHGRGPTDWAARNASGIFPGGEVLAADVPVHPKVAGQLHARVRPLPRPRLSPPRAGVERGLRLPSSMMPRSTAPTCSVPSMSSRISRATSVYRRACPARGSSASPDSSSRSRAYSAIVWSIRSRPSCRPPG